MKTEDDLRHLFGQILNAVDAMLEPQLTRVQLVYKIKELQRMLDGFNGEHYEEDGVYAVG